MLRLRDREIGGGIVRRTFKMGDEQLFAGRKLTRDEVLSIRAPNRNSLIEKGQLDVWPLDAQAQRYVVPTGKNEFGVIIGHMMNDKPLTKAEAEALAAQPN